MQFKRKILLNIFCLIIGSNAISQLNWQINEEFNGPVKSVKTLSYELGWKVMLPEPDTFTNYTDIQRKVFLFDAFKRPVKSIILNRDSDTSAYCIFLYDNFGRIKKELDYREHDRLEQTLEYEYKKDGSIIEKTFLPKQGLIDTWVKRTDSLHHYQSSYELVKGKRDDQYWTFFNDSFMPTETYWESATGPKIKTGEYTYNPNGNMVISHEDFNSDSTKTRRYEYRYDEYGNKIEITTFDISGKLITIVHQQFDQHKNAIRIFTFYPEDPAFVSIIERIDYKYDQYGNWISKKSYQEFRKGDEFLDSKIYRSIEYYE